MTVSAKLGTPPATHYDSLVIDGFYKLMSMMVVSSQPGTKPHPSIIPVKTPPNAPHDSVQWKLYGAMSSVIILTVLITGTRLMTRVCKRDLRWGLDDWTIIPAAALVITYCSLVINTAAFGGGGKHMYDATYAEYDQFNANTAHGPPIYYCALGMIKISICFFNRRLTGFTSRNWTIFHYTMLIGLMSYIVTAIFGFVFACKPIWTSMRISDLGSRDYETTCFKGDTNFVTAMGIIHIFFDFFLLPVPLIVMKRLNMSRSQRIRLALLFSVGSLSFIGAVCRATVMKGKKQKDMMYQYPDMNRWTVIDITFAMAVASLPTLNALLPKQWRKRGSNVYANTSTNYPESTSSPHGAPTQLTKTTTNTSSQAYSSESGSRAPSSKDAASVHVVDEIDIDIERAEMVDDMNEKRRGKRGGSSGSDSQAATTNVAPAPSNGFQPEWEKHAPRKGS